MSGVGDIRERRKQRILGNSEERMKKLMGINDKFVAENSNKLESTEKEPKKEKIEVKEKKFRKISFGNMVANNKMAEKLRKERKISLNLERIWPINEEISGRDLVNEAGRRDFENRKLEIEKLKELQRPPLKNVDHIYEKRVSARDVLEKEYQELQLKKEIEKKDREFLERGQSFELENQHKEDEEEEEVFNDMEGRALIENYEAKLRSLEEFARRIEDDGKYSNNISQHKKTTKQKVEREEAEDEKTELLPGPPSPPPTRNLFMLVLGVFCRLFISFLPLYLQNIMVVFMSAELMIISYQLHFKTSQLYKESSSPHFLVAALLSMLGVNKKIYLKFMLWVSRIGKIIGDLAIFLFSFVLLHHFLHDPLACEFDAR